MEISVLREAIRAFLAGKTVAGEQVYDSRVVSIDEKLPLINIFTPTDVTDGEMLVTDVQIALYISIGAGDRAEKPMDDFRLSVRRLLSDYMDNLDAEMAYRGRTTEFEREASKPHVIQVLNYEIETLDEL